MKATLEIEFKNSGAAKKALNSLKQETSFRKKSTASMEIRGKTLVIEIEAGTFPAMRAAVHSYLRLLNVVFSVINITKKVIQDGHTEGS